MEKIISSVDERNMVNAIEKAASIALANEERDRSDIVAAMLKEARVPERFAKTAAAAFNKRLTVLTFKGRDDMHKAASFPLADPEKVAELMTAVPVKKVAATELKKSAFGSFVTGAAAVASASMQKAASVQQPTEKPRYEDRVSYEVFRKHIEGMLDKQGALVQNAISDADILEKHLEESIEGVATFINKSAKRDIILDTATNLYGAAFESLFGERIEGAKGLKKTASAVRRPDSKLYDEIERVIALKSIALEKRANIAEQCEGIIEFGKSAAAMVDLVQTAMMKQAADPWPWVTMAASNVFGSAVDAYDAATRSAMEIGGTGANLYLDAKNRYNKATVPSAKPADVLTADFISNDRYRDRLLGWADMAADPALAIYPAEDVFRATQKAMDTSRDLESPANREVLRTTVGQLLAQNNRLSAADLAALATTSKARAAINTTIDKATALTRALDAKTGIDVPESHTLEIAQNAVKNVRDIREKLEQSFATRAKETAEFKDKMHEQKSKERDAKERKEREEKLDAERAEDRAYHRAQDQKRDAEHAADLDYRHKQDEARKERESKLDAERAEELERRRTREETADMERTTRELEESIRQADRDRQKNRELELREAEKAIRDAERAEENKRRADERSAAEAAKAEYDRIGDLFSQRFLGARDAMAAARAKDPKDPNRRNAIAQADREIRDVQFNFTNALLQSPNPDVQREARNRLMSMPKERKGRK